MLRLPSDWPTSKSGSATRITVRYASFAIGGSTSHGGRERFGLETSTFIEDLLSPRSEAEEINMEKALRQLSAGDVEVFETAEERIRDLHKAREEYQAKRQQAQ